MKTDDQILAEIDLAFGDCGKPDHFTDFKHCEECADHDELLRSRDRSSLKIGDVGNPGWDPILFCLPEGISYFMPALTRIALEKPTEEFGWYGGLLVLHLSPQDWPSPFYQYCTPVQRKAVAALLNYFMQSRSSSDDFDAREVEKAIGRWKD